MADGLNLVILVDSEPFVAAIANFYRVATPSVLDSLT